MFERGITAHSVLAVIAGGDADYQYPDDTPYPSSLLFGVVAGRPTPVVVANEVTGGVCIVVTVYEPTADQWGPDFRTKAAVNYVICRNGKTKPGHATVTVQRGETTVILKRVPADVCENCRRVLPLRRGD